MNFSPLILTFDFDLYILDKTKRTQKYFSVLLTNLIF